MWRDGNKKKQTQAKIKILEKILGRAGWQKAEEQEDEIEKVKLMGHVISMS